MTSHSHWIYPTNPKSGYYLDTLSGLKEVSPQTLLPAIEENLNRVDFWHLSTGYRSIRPGDAVWMYAGGESQYIYALAIAVQVGEVDNDWYVDLIWNIDATRALTAEPIPRTRFDQTPRSPQYAPSRRCCNLWPSASPSASCTRRFAWTASSPDRRPAQKHLHVGDVLRKEPPVRVQRASRLVRAAATQRRDRTG